MIHDQNVFRMAIKNTVFSYIISATPSLFLVTLRSQSRTKMYHAPNQAKFMGRSNRVVALLRLPESSAMGVR